MRRRQSLQGIVVGLALSLLIGVSCSDQPTDCKLDARTGPNGETYGRDPNQGCKFVDEDGKVLPDQ